MQAIIATFVSEKEMTVMANSDQNNSPLRIDVGEVVRQRVPRYYKRIPHFMISWLSRIIHQDELNEILQLMHEAGDGLPAVDAANRYLGVSAELVHEERIPEQGRFIFASNHPLGGLDGLALLSLMGHRYGGEHIRFMVNDLLMAVRPLRPLFLPVNKYGCQSRQEASDIESQYAGTNQMLTFPAGLCSRQMSGGDIHDLPWQPSVASMAVRSQRDIVPLYFDGVNSRRFYRLAHLRKQLGIKFNYEMVLLPDEVVRGRGKHFKVYVGQPVPWQSLDSRHPRQEAERLCRLTYALAPSQGGQ